jgi:hypothetical protein
MPIWTLSPPDIYWLNSNAREAISFRLQERKNRLLSVRAVDG